jgi:hypothetical protein
MFLQASSDTSLLDVNIAWAYNFVLCAGSYHRNDIHHIISHMASFGGCHSDALYH